MSDVALLLGPIVFQDFEIPSGINFGGRQRMAVHWLPGGTRVIDAIGRDDAQISFSGVFTGSNATLRARSLDELRVAGIVLPLTWDVFFYTVLISEFRADYRSGWWIPYRIVCTVLQDEASMLLQLGISLATAALSDIGAAVSYGSSAGLDLTSVQSLLAAPGATTRGTAAYTAAQVGLAQAQTSVDGSMNAANGTLGSIDFASVGTAQNGVTALATATDASGQLSSLTAAGAYVQRAATNLTNAST